MTFGWSLFIAFAMSLAIAELQCRLQGYRNRPKPQPDPIEIEARQLAEIEVEELCRLLEGNFEPARTDSVTRDSVQMAALTDPLTDPKAAMSVIPLVLKGPERELEYIRCFCTGCGEWNNDPDSHVHVYNAMGDVVFSYLENGNRWA